MRLRVVGAGLGRTGTLSLKLALEQLLGMPCYHMVEVFSHPDHVAVWRRAARGEPPDWQQFFKGYGAVLDWPAASFWHELSEAFPDAVVLHSVRDAESWWVSANHTIFSATQKASGPWRAMIDDVLGARFTPLLEDREACIDAFEHHNARVREQVVASRLVRWEPGDGWAPLCKALNVPVPDSSFPHVNSSSNFRAEVRRRAPTGMALYAPSYDPIDRHSHRIPIASGCGPSGDHPAKCLVESMNTGDRVGLVR